MRYEAARIDGQRAKMVSGSADGDLLPDLDTLRAKSNALVRDDAHASAAIRVYIENVVGNGIVPQAAVRPEETGLTQAQCDELNAAQEAVFARWSEDMADANEVEDFHGLTAMVCRGRLVDGETFAHRIAVPGRELSTAWELIDPARVDNTTVPNPAVRYGVEIGERGQPIAYWIAPQHPDDAMFLRAVDNRPIRIERTKAGGWHNVLHVFRRDRAGQSRGVPIIVPALGLFEQLHHYLDSEVIAARTNANTAAIVERNVDPSNPGTALRQEFENPHGRGDGAPIWHEAVQPGTYQYLNPGEKFTPYNPQRPGTTFDPFVIRILRAIAGAMGLSYELIVKDFARMNFTSSRAKLNEVRRGLLREQNLLIARWCRPVWQTVQREAIASGLVPIYPQMAVNMRPFLAARWIRPAWGWVDPVKEIEASSKAVAENLSTRQVESLRSGMDLEEVLEAAADEWLLRRAIERRKGLPDGTLDIAPKAGAAPPPSVAPGAVPDGEDEDEGADGEPEDSGEDEEP